MANLKQSIQAASPIFRRVIAKCACCGKEHTSLPTSYKTTSEGDVTYYWYYCECRSGLVSMARNGLVQTPAEQASYFAFKGVSA